MVEMHKGRKVMFKNPAEYGTIKTLKGGTTLWSSPEGELANGESVEAAKEGIVFTIERVCRDGWVYLEGLDMPVRKCFLTPASGTTCKCSDKKRTCKCSKDTKEVDVERFVSESTPFVISAATTAARISAVVLKSIDSSMDQYLRDLLNSTKPGNREIGKVMEQLVQQYADQAFDVVRAVNSTLFPKNKKESDAMNKAADSLFDEMFGEEAQNKIPEAVKPDKGKKCCKDKKPFRLTEEQEHILTDTLDKLVDKLGLGDGADITVKIGKIN